MSTTIGISPKVIVPLVIQLVGAIILYILGEQELGISLIGTAVVTAVSGYAAPAGAVLDVQEIE